MSASRSIAILYKYVPQYRQHFFNVLKQELSKESIELRLIYGQPSPKEAAKQDAVTLSWGQFFPNTITRLGKTEFYWQPVLSAVKDVDLVIVEQASRLLVNYPLLLKQRLRQQKVAFWGHGRNFQTETSNPISEWIKRLISTRVHWWFAYNQTSADVVARMGFPRSRITQVQNAIDTRDLVEARKNLTSVALDTLRMQHGITGKSIGLYVGGMYLEKRLGFLLEACQIIRQQIPDFEMLFIGAGKDAVIVEQAARNQPWIHYLGPLFGLERAAYFALADAFLMPGAVGLAILDCFALQLPLLTIQHDNHGPEIEYLINGENGLIFENTSTPIDYAQQVVSYLSNPILQNKLKNGCLHSSQQYTIEDMVARFVQGVTQALNTP